MDNGKPKISVITVVYNGAAHLEETMLSVLGQTYGNVEYIIVDGGSTDGTQEIIRKYGQRLQDWISEPDNGIYDAMNKGIARATGEWLVFMNADDRFFERETLQKILPFLDTEAAVVYGNVHFTDYVVEYTYVPGRIGYLSFLKHVLFNHQAMLFNRQKMLPYDLSMKISADFDLVFRLYKRYGARQFVKVEQVMAVCRLSGVSSRHLFASFKDRLRSFQKHDRALYLLLLLYTPFFYVKTGLLRVVRGWPLYRWYKKVKHRR